MTSEDLCLLNCSGAGLCSSLPQLVAAARSGSSQWDLASSPFEIAGLGTPTFAYDTPKPARTKPMCLCTRGHAGVGCEMRAAVCPNDCSGHGSCIRTLNGAVVATATCRCAPGHAGESCAFACEERCNGRGHCLLTGDRAAVSEGSQTWLARCMCSQGWVGRTCATAVSSVVKDARL